MPYRKKYKKRHTIRKLKAQWHYLLVLIHEFRWTLFTFFCVITIGTFFIYYFYPNNKLSLLEALYGNFNLIFAQSYLTFPPGPWFLQIIFFIVPILGLAVIVEGLVRFGIVLFNKEHKLEEWQKMLAKTYSNHIVICGLGRVGYRVAKELYKLGQDIIGIEKNPQGEFINDLKELDIPIIFDDITRPDALKKANVIKAKTIIAATDNDVANLNVGLSARDINPNIRVILRIFDEKLADKIEKNFNISVVFSTSALSAPAFAAATFSKNVIHSFYVKDQLVCMSKIKIKQNSPLVNMKVQELEDKYNITAVSYEGKDVCDLHPHSQRELKADDVITIISSLETLSEIEKLNG